MRSFTGLEHRVDRSWIQAAVIAFVCHLVWYGHDVVLGGFRNLDVAGIAYNARLLLAGDLPYVDSWEPKPPGSFFLFATILAFGSMHTVWAVAILWGTATSLSVGLLAARIWGRRFLLPAVAFHAAGTLLPTQADINYVFWATLPFVLAAAMAFKPREEVARPRLHWLLVGAVAACAVLLKQSTMALIVVLALAVLLRAGENHLPRLRAAAWGTAGAALVFLALSLPWLFAGEVGALIAGLGLSGGWWVDYAAAQTEPMGGVVSGIGGGLVYIFKTLQIGSAAAILGIAGRPRGRDQRWAYIAAIVFLVASFAGMAVTLRFYLHYLAQFWAAMVIVALHPAGYFVRLLDWVAGLGARRVLACLFLGLFGTLLRIDAVANARVKRATWDRIVQDLCAVVEPYLAPSDPVLAWGWPSWGLYTHCDRRAPGPIYKAMTVVTTPNTNTGWRRSDTMVLRPGEATDRYISDFLANRPALVLWSSGYARYGNEPLLEMPAISQVLEAEYRGVDLGGDYVAFLRHDLHERVRAAHPLFDQDLNLRDALERLPLDLPPRPTDEAALR